MKYRTCVECGKHYKQRCGTGNLYQIGTIGLMKAIRNFDTSYNVCFSTYAVPMIAGEIKRYLRDDGIIKYLVRLRVVCKGKGPEIMSRKRKRAH